LAEPVLEKPRREALAQCHEVCGTDYGLIELEPILQACHYGQVDKLLLDVGQAMCSSG